MFYPVELLSHRRKGKLAACWLAAITSAKLFKRYYNSIAIKKMNITKTCEEILRVIQSRKSNALRFSLYLSSQLMCGVTKIHLYQITYYQKDVFEIWQELDLAVSLKKTRQDFDAVRTLEDTFPTDLPSLIHSAHLDEDLHVLPGETADGRLQIIMQDATCQNFGALTDDELDFLLNHDLSDILFNLSKKMQIVDDSKERDVTEMMADIEIAEKVYREMQSPRAICSPVLVDISKSKTKSKGGLSITPQKRQTRQLQIETPTKRRRLSFEDAAMPPMPPPIPSEDAIVPELSVEKTLTSASPLAMKQTIAPSQQQTELDMELESLHSSFFIIEKHPRRGKFIDKGIILDDKLFKQRLQDINIWCRKKLNIPQIHHRISAMELLNQPSHYPWCNKLYDLFANHIIGPFTIPNKNVTSAEMQSEEAIRLGETTSRLMDLPTGEWSTLGKIHTTTIIDALESIPNIHNIPEIPSMAERADIIHETRETSTIPLAETDIILEQDISISERMHDQKKTDTSYAETLLDIENMLEEQRIAFHSKTMDRISKSVTPYFGIFFLFVSLT